MVGSIKAESMTYSRYQQLKPEDFKRLCGVHHQTFLRMVAVLEEQVEQKKKKPGKPSKLSVSDQVLISLEYWREYRTYFHIGQAWKVHESTVSRIVRKVENALIRAGVFQLPGRKQLLELESVANLVVIDATETPIERPKKGQRRFYSGKKKRHTFKTQLVVDPKTKAVIFTTFAAGKEHENHLFKRSRVQLKKETLRFGR